MPQAGLLSALFHFLGSRRFFWILASLVGSILVFYFLFASFFFNPFEDPLEDTAAVVPREVDYFFRVQDVSGRFESFPMPIVWSDFQKTSIHSKLSEGGELDRLGAKTGISELFESIQGVVNSLPPGLDAQEDLFREVAIAGRGVPGSGRAFDGMVMTRSSFKVRAGVSLLDFDFVRSKLPKSLGVQSLGDGRWRFPKFPPFGYQDAYLARVRDVLILASREEWIDSARSLELQSGQDSLAQASIFYDNVEAYLGPGDRPIEAFVRWEKLRQSMGRWPKPSGFTFSEKLASSFFDSEIFRFLSGYWLAGNHFEGRLSGELDLSNARSYQRTWLQASPVGASRIRELASAVPADSFFFGVVAGDPGKVLQQVEGAMEPDIRRILDEIVVNTGQYQGVGHLLGEVGRAFSPGLCLSLRRDDYPGDAARDVEHDNAPVPLVALLGKLRDRAAFSRLIEFFKANAWRFSGGEERPRLQRVELRGNTSGIAFASPAFPGTGEILVVEIPALRMAIISNSYKYAEKVVQTALVQARDVAVVAKLSEKPEFRRAVQALDGGAHLFSYSDPLEAKHWLDELIADLASISFRNEMETVFVQERPQVELSLRAKLFGGGAVSAEQAAQLQKAVDQAMLNRRESLRGIRIPEIQKEINLAVLPLTLFDWLSAGFKVRRREASLMLAGSLSLD